MLRSINVAGHNRITMRVLKDLVEGLGVSDVATYLQSGNVVFRAPRAPRRDLAAAIETAITASLGLRITVLVRTGAELGAVVSANPFAAGAHDPTRVHVTFLREAPGPRRAGGAEPAGRVGDDEYRIAGREVYLHCPSGYGRTTLTNAFWERRFATAATTRNFKTVRALAEMAGR
jgi:uncharacterized protein (DUF1697 family)